MYALAARWDTRCESYRALTRLWEEQEPKTSVLGGHLALERRLLGAVRLVRLDDRSERGDRLVVAAEPHHDHALRRAAEALHVLDRDLDHGAGSRDEHHLVAVADDARADEVAARLVELDGLDAHSAAALDRVLGDACSLAEAVLGHDEQVGVVLGAVDRDHLVAGAELNAGVPIRVAAHRPGVCLVEADRLALLRDHEDVVATGRVADADELVAVAHLDRDH